MIGPLLRFAATWWRRALLICGVLLGALYVVAFLQTFRAEEPRAFHADPLEVLGTPSAAAGGPDALAPRAVWQAARAWSETVNKANPGAIVGVLDADAFGTLHLYVGAKWGEFPPEAQRQQVDALGRFWRAYLGDAVAEWNRQGTFAPGVVLYDWEGAFAYNVNGEVAIIRPASFPPEVYANGVDSR